MGKGWKCWEYINIWALSLEMTKNYTKKSPKQDKIQWTYTARWEEIWRPKWGYIIQSISHYFVRMRNMNHFEEMKDKHNRNEIVKKKSKETKFEKLRKEDTSVVKEQLILQKMQSRKLNWYWHVNRMEPKKLIRIG